MGSAHTVTEGRRPPLSKRRFIIDPPFQYRLIGTFVAMWFANSVFFALVMFALFDGHLKQFYELVPRAGVIPLMGFPALVGSAVAVVTLFGAVVFVLVAVHMSNQIAGPLHRMKACLTMVGGGQLGHGVQIRQGDFLQDLPAVVNTMLNGLRRQSVLEAEELESMETDCDDPELRERLRALKLRKLGQLDVVGGGAALQGERDSMSMVVH